MIQRMIQTLVESVYFDNDENLLKGWKRFL